MSYLIIMYSTIYIYIWSYHTLSFLLSPALESIDETGVGDTVPDQWGRWKMRGTIKATPCGYICRKREREREKNTHLLVKPLLILLRKELQKDASTFKSLVLYMYFWNNKTHSETNNKKKSTKHHITFWVFPKIWGKPPKSSIKK